MKKKQLELCSQIKNREIRIIECEEEYHQRISFAFGDEDIEQIYAQIKNFWDTKDFIMGIGSFISTEKIKQRKFDSYDGLFTPAPRTVATIYLKNRAELIYADFLRVIGTAFRNSMRKS